MAGTHPRRAAPARSRRSTRNRPSSATPGSAGTGAAAAAGPKRRFFDYPRSGYHGLHRWLPSWRVSVGVLIGMFFLGAGAAVAAYASVKVPTDIGDDVKSQTTTVYYAPNPDGTQDVMGTFSVQNRQIVPYASLPKYVGDAVVAAEDRTFFDNTGVDLKGMARAFWYNVHKSSNARAQGGSTLTQQFVERYYVDKTTTDYVGKAKEAILAVKVTQSMDKTAILEGYLNTIYWGRDAYGIQAAAQAYFKKDAKDLTVSEAAMLAGIIPSPNNWDPEKSLEKSTARWTIVMDSMEEIGAISPADRAAQKFPDTWVPYQRPNAMVGPQGLLLQMVRNELQKPPLSLKDEEIDRRGYKVVTTIQKPLQDQAVAAGAGFSAGSLEGQDGAVPNARTKVTISSVDPKTGGIVALYGGPNDEADQTNHATYDNIQPGSTFKPFTLIGALESGIPLSKHYNGASPQKLKGWDPADPNATVRNFGAGKGEQFGDIDLVDATAESVNTVYAQLNLEIGADKTVDVATRAGIVRTTVPNVPSNVLGTTDAKALDMVSAYATIASGGTRIPPHIVASVANSDDSTAYQADTTGTKVFEADVIADTTYAMQQVVEDDKGTGHDWIKPLGRPIAGKTGTTSLNKAAWFVGFTPNIATEVSLFQYGPDGTSQESIEAFGKDKRGRAIKEITGATWPAFVWATYMKQAFTLPQYSQVVEFPPRANVNKGGATSTAVPEETATEEPVEEATQQAPQTVAVPNVDGKLEADATAVLVGQGLSASVVTEPSDSVSAGRVIRADPKVGAQVPAGSSVTIVVSTGPKPQQTQPPPADPPPTPTPTEAPANP
ncbi:transglycosylase domain-containing protein [Cellulomonas sp. URHB0016]